MEQLNMRRFVSLGISCLIIGSILPNAIGVAGATACLAAMLWMVFKVPPQTN